MISTGRELVRWTTTPPPSPSRGGAIGPPPQLIYPAPNLVGLDVVLNEEGNYACLAGSDFVEISRTGQLVRTIIRGNGPTLGLTIDVDTGDYVMVNSADSAASIVRVTPGGTVTTLHLAPYLTRFFALEYDPPTGAFVVLSTAVENRGIPAVWFSGLGLVLRN